MHEHIPVPENHEPPHVGIFRFARLKQLVGRLIGRGASNEPQSTIESEQHSEVQEVYEVEPPQSPVQGLFRDITSPDAQAKQLTGLQTEVAYRQSDDFKKVGKQLEEKLNEARRTDESAISTALQAVVAHENQVAERYFLERQMDVLQEGRMTLLASTDPRSQQLMTTLKQSAQLPGRYFIEAHHFVDFNDDGARSRPTIAIEAHPDNEPMKLPLANFVSAQAFESWSEGRGQVQKQDDIGRVVTSQEIIADYATRSTTPPPIERVTGYIQPNGLILYVTEGGSHRTAAAIQRGDTSIDTRLLTLKEIPHDFITEE